MGDAHPICDPNVDDDATGCIQIACDALGAVNPYYQFETQLNQTETKPDAKWFFEYEYHNKEHMGQTFCGSDGHMYYYYDFLTAAYMVSVSMTSIGYGDYSPQGWGPRVFSVFWIMLGTLMNANAWGKLITWLIEWYQDVLDAKKINMAFDAKSILKIDKDHGGTVDELEFVTHMLLKTNKIDLLTLTDIRRKFSELDASGDGVITKEDIAMQEAKDNGGVLIPQSSKDMSAANKSTAKVVPTQDIDTVDTLGEKGLVATSPRNPAHKLKPLGEDCETPK